MNTLCIDETSNRSFHGVGVPIDVLKLADKYACTHAIRSQMALAARNAAAEHVWNRKDQALDYEQNDLFEALLDSLAISYVVEDEEAF